MELCRFGKMAIVFKMVSLVSEPVSEQVFMFLDSPSQTLEVSFRDTVTAHTWCMPAQATLSVLSVETVDINALPP